MGVLPCARAQYPTAPGWAPARCLTRIISYDAYTNADFFFTQPLQIAVGSVAGSKWTSDDLLTRRQQGQSHAHRRRCEPYPAHDGRTYVDEAASILVDEAAAILGAFFKKHLRDVSAGETRGVAAEWGFAVLDGGHEATGYTCARTCFGDGVC